MLFTVSGGDGITLLPHMGYIIRTQPNSYLQGGRLAQFILGDHVKKLAALSAQTPFAVDSYNRLAEVLNPGGVQTVSNVIYDPTKTTFRTEIDQTLKSKPDALFLNSYTPDLTVLLRELYRAGYDGKKYTLGYAANAKLLDSLPADVVEGLVSYAPTPDIGSPAYARVKQILDADPDPYAAQIYDHISLIALSIARAKTASGRPSTTTCGPSATSPEPRSPARSTASSCSPTARRWTTRARPARASSPPSATSRTASSASTSWRRARTGC